MGQTSYKHKKGYDCITFKLSNYVISPSNTPAPRVTSATPTGSVVGPTRGSVGQQLTYVAAFNEPGGDLLDGGIYWGLTAGNNFTTFGASKLSGSSGSFSASWTPAKPGTYYIMMTGSDLKGLSCTGNPFAQNSLSPPYPSCGPGSSITVIISPSATASPAKS